MRTHFIALLTLAAVVGLPDLSRAQSTPVSGVDAACRTQQPLPQTTLGAAVASTGCGSVAPLTGDDYVGVHVSWVPAATERLDPAQAAFRRERGRATWRQVIVALRRQALFRVEETGIVTLRIFRARSGLPTSENFTGTGESWSRCGEGGAVYRRNEYDLLVMRPLTSWSISENRGFSAESLSSALSGRQGPVFPGDTANGLEVELCLSHVRTVTPALVQALERVADLATLTGRDTQLISEAVVSRLRGLEADVARQANFTNGTAQPLQVAWGPDGIHRIDMDIGVPWARVSEGAIADRPSKLSVRVEMVGSLFSGSHAYSGTDTRFNFAGGRSTVLRQRLTTLTVEQAIEPELIRALSDDTISPAVWEESCKLVERRLGQYPLSALNDPDTRAVVWAVLGQTRLSAPEVRRQPCSERMITDPQRLAAFSAAGLPIVSVAIPRPAGEYGLLLTRAGEVALAANGAASQAQQRRAAISPQTFTVVEPAVGGEFFGVLDPNGLGTGRIVFDAPGYEGAIWEGEVRKEAFGVVAQGLGVFTYAVAASAREGCAEPRRVLFSGTAHQNQMRSGQIAYCDNTLFSGVVSEQENPVFGVMRFAPQNETQRLLYGDFSGRRFGTGGQGVEEVRRLVEGQFITDRYRTGLWLEDAFLGD